MGWGLLCSIGVGVWCTYAKNVPMVLSGVVCVHIGSLGVRGGGVHISYSRCEEVTHESVARSPNLGAFGSCLG